MARLFDYQNEAMLSAHPLGWDYYNSAMSAPFIAGQISDFNQTRTDTGTCDDALGFGLVVCDANAGVGGLGVTPTPPNDTSSSAARYGTAYRVELPSPANTKFTAIIRHEHIDPVLGGVRANPPRTAGTVTPVPPGAPPTPITPPPAWQPGTIQPPPQSGIITDPWQVYFPAKYPVPLLKEGRIAVQIDSDVKGVTPTCPVFVRLIDSPNGIDKRGQCRLDNREGSVQWLVGVRWTGRIMPGRLAELSINVS